MESGMKALLVIVCAFLPQLLFSEPAQLKTVDHVDLARYVGKWYEIARYPNRFEKGCASDVTADYERRDSNKIAVTNACRRSDGKSKESKGTAKVVDAKSNAKLKVTFFWLFSGEYWVIDLDPDYTYAVVGEPDRKYLWVLSRTSELAPGVYERIMGKVRELGYDPAKLVKTPQGLRDNAPTDPTKGDASSLTRFGRCAYH
jgi:apolipoprotein D and lipocalin family protein